MFISSPVEAPTILCTPWLRTWAASASASAGELAGETGLWEGVGPGDVVGAWQDGEINGVGKECGWAGKNRAGIEMRVGQPDKDGWG